MSPKIETPVDVTIYTVTPQTIPVHLKLIGVVQSSHSVEIRSRVEGYLQKIAFKEGAFVNKGDLLFEIDPAQFQDAVNAATANLEKEKVGQWLAQKAVDRYTPLFKEKAASQKDMDDATGQLLSAQASVSEAQAKLDQAVLNLSYATITSPISGIASYARFHEGAFITKASDVLTTVSVLDPIWVMLNVSESYYLITAQKMAQNELSIPENANFDVTLTIGENLQYPYDGKVSFVSPLYDQSTGTLGVRSVFENPNQVLKPGQFVHATVSGAMRHDAVIVPQEAIDQGMSGYFVFVVNNASRIETRAVELGDWYEQYWIVKSGLKKGDKVVVTGLNKIRDGTLVKVVPK